MSYDIYLQEPITKEDIEFDRHHFLKGGTYEIGGTQKAWLNITYNYSEHYHRTMGEEGIRTIYGMTGAESVPILKSAIEQLGNDITNNYWDGTEGNAKLALLKLVALAEMRPDGIWDGD